LQATGLTTPHSDSSDEEMIIYSREFLTMESPIAALATWITPTKSFFVRNNLIMPTSIDVEKWELRIAGEVRRPITLSFRDLAALPKTSVINTIECAGNGRAFYHPRLGGIQWRKGAVGNAQFEGPRLRDLLRLAVPAPSAHHVAFGGLDTAPMGSERFIRSIPLEKALDENSLVSTHMNGAPLTMPHGFPARALIPGWIGSASIKWLQEITVLSHEYSGAYMDPAYRIPAAQVQNHSVTTKATLPLTSLRLKSIISQPGENAEVNLCDSSTVAIRGSAWGGEKSISSVKVSTDGGTTWQDTVLGSQHTRYAWRLWEYNWTPPAAGNYQLVCRAADVEGNRQPLQPLWNGGGYLWNGMDRVNVHVQA
jgi:DMSO/TMAO reductase YedYZ molybdopterin-dependent catalytic subunit